MPDKNGIYSAVASKEDEAFLLENFVEGTKWFIYEYGESKGLFTVGDRFELGGKVRNHVTRDRDGTKDSVFLFVLQAKPYKN